MRGVVAGDLFPPKDGPARLLAGHGFEIAAAAATAPSLLCALLEQQPGVAVADVRLPPAFAGDGLQAALMARRQVYCCSQYVGQLYAHEMLADQAGAVGYLLKDRAFRNDQLVDAIRGQGHLFLWLKGWHASAGRRTCKPRPLPTSG